MDLAGYAETLKEDTDENFHVYLKAVEAFKEAKEIFDSAEFQKKVGWKKEAEDEQIGAVVHSRRINRRKIFSMKVELTANYEVFFLNLFKNIDTDHEWNTNMEQGKRITWLGNQSDVAYHALKDFWVLKGRDMLAARIWRKLGDSIVMAGRSVDYSLAPVIENKIRAETILAAGQFSAIQGRPDGCLVEYLICCDLKGWIPKQLIDALMGRLLIADAVNLRKRAQQITEMG